MTTIDAKRAFAKAIGLGLLAVLAGTTASEAGSTRTELQRQQILQNGEKAQDQRDDQMKDTANKQQQLLDYQIRKSKRTARKIQCQTAGLSNC